MKVALVHDWLVSMRGGEKVLEALCEMFPRADVFTLLHNPGRVSTRIESHRIITSFINRLPGKRRYYPYYLPLFPTAIESFSLKGYELILSSSHCVAKGVRTPPDALHISYIHTPMRYVWDMYEDYFGPGRAGPITRLFMPLLANYLRIWDSSSASRVDWFVANSRHVAKRIYRYYRREAEVIHPPVDTDRFPLSEQPGEYFLVVSSLVPYKRIDLAVEVFNERGEPLLIIGEGPEKKHLQKMARPNIKFLPWQEPHQLAAYYQKCHALIFPGEEDFGIVPVEAQSCGRPVIAYGRGGALETVIGFRGDNEGKCTGVFFQQQTGDALNQALEQWRKLHWDARFIHRHAQKFSRQQFFAQMEAFIQQKWDQFRQIGEAALA